MAVIFNPLSGDLIALPPLGDASWKANVASVAALPLTGNSDGDKRTENSGYTCWIWEAGTTSWSQLAGSPAGNGFGLIQGDHGPTATATTLDDTLDTTSSDGSVITTGGTKSMNFQVAPRKVTGTGLVGTAVTAAGGIVVSTPALPSVLYIKGNAAPITVTANPQITAPTVDGVEIDICGAADGSTNTVTIADGTGLKLNGPRTIGPDSLLTLVADLANSRWREKGYNGL